MKKLSNVKNKNGMLLASEVIKIVLGLIGIILLVWLLSAIYFSNIDQKRLLQAKSTIERISENINLIQYNSTFVGKVNEISPLKWSIFSFVGDVRKPDSCSNSNCLCICDSVREDYLVYTAENRQEKECSEDGTCLIIENLNSFEEIPIEKLSNGFTNIQIKKVNNKIEVTKYGFG
ncbi:MAG: hypothetical protein WC812_03640 [Candidatus Pacearchaeota archaeon]|jgi:hypothetical protein